MTTPPYQPGPYGQPNQDPYGQGGYGQQRPPRQPHYGQPQYGGQYSGGNDQTQQFGTPPQNPYGAPPYGGQPQWPGSGPGGIPPQPPKKNTGVVVAIVVVALLVLAGAGAGLYYVTKKDDAANTAGETSTSAPDKTDGGGESSQEETAEEPGEAIEAQPGDCIKVNVASSTNADVETVDCTSAEAIYKVATREDTDTESCPNDQYVSYTEEDQLLLCLQLNVSEGDCLKVADADTRVECADPAATHKVVAVLDGVDDETRCPDEGTTEVVTYPKPPLTVCLGSPTA
jgi:hypothetical protein